MRPIERSREATKHLQTSTPVWPRAIAAMLFLLAAHAPLEAQTARATRVPAEVLQAAMRAAEPTELSDEQIRMIDAGDINLGVAVAHAPLTEQLASVIHFDVAEIFYILRGRGVLVSGDRIGEALEADPGSQTVRDRTGPDASGYGIPGGESTSVGPGDVVFIPEGTAHGFSEVTEPLTYLVFRVDPDKLVALK